MELRKGRFIYSVLVFVSFVFIGIVIGQTTGVMQQAATSELSAGVQKALADITKQELHAHVKFLASDLLEGRGTPGRGLDIAAEYLATQFECIGLEQPGPNDNYLQPYSIYQYDSTPQNTEVSLFFGEEKLALSPDQRLLVLFGLSGQTPNVLAPIVFAGYGITSPEHKWDDYAKIDVKDKTVLVLAGAPWETNLKAIFGYDKLLGKMINAKAHGAAGFISASPNFGKEEPLSESFMRAVAAHGHNLLLPSDSRVSGMSVPSITTSFEVVDKILSKSKASPRTVLKLAEKMNKSKKSISFEIPEVTFQIDVQAEFTERSASNVIGMIPGADEQLKDEFVVFSAHFDHEGVGMAVKSDSIYNGADDNASGTAAILELAEAFMSLSDDQRPKRSLFFLLISGEEKGLYGSAYYSEHSFVPFSKVIANINIDMIGRSDSSKIQVIAPGSKSLYQIVSQANKHIGLNIMPDQQPEMRLIYLSDHYQFARHNVPVAFFFTGLHPDYHQPSDEIDKINFSDFEKIVRLIFLSGLEVANAGKTPEWKQPETFIVNP